MDAMKVEWKWTNESDIDFKLWAAYWLCSGYIVYAISNSMCSPFVGCTLRDGVLYSFNDGESWNVDDPVGVHDGVVWFAESKLPFQVAIEQKAQELSKHDKLPNTGV